MLANFPTTRISPMIRRNNAVLTTACFSTVYNVKILAPSDIMVVFEHNNCFRLTETAIAELFYDSHRIGTEQFFL